MDYPSKPPSVYFLQPTPRHEHVYTNGDICLNLLGRDWRPNMTASTLALSILSMLSSAKEKKIPQDNHVREWRARDVWMGLFGCVWWGFRMEVLVIATRKLIHSFIAFHAHMCNTHPTDADNPPGKAQQGWLYHDDKC